MLSMLYPRESRENFMLHWAFGGLWIFICAFLWAPSRDGLEGIFALAFFIPMLLLLPWRKPQFHHYGGWFSIVALSYAGWSCLSSLWGDKSPAFILQWLVLASWLLGSAWVVQRRVLKLDKLFAWLVAIGSVVALVACAVFYREHSMTVRLQGLGIARTSTIAGQLFGLVTLLAIMLSWRTPHYGRAQLFFAAALCGLAALLLSQSRGPLLALILALLLCAYWLRPLTKVWLSQLLFVSAVALLLVLFTPVENALVERGISFSLRDEIWLQIWQNLSTQPLAFVWGIGMSEDTHILTAVGEYHHAHNAWLDILYRTGAIGLLLALAHLTLLITAGVRSAAARPLVIWLLYGCGCLLVDSRSLFWELDAKWLLYWVPAALLAAQLSLARESAKAEQISSELDKS